MKSRGNHENSAGYPGKRVKTYKENQGKDGLNPNIVYNYLPKLNCGKCEEKSCFTFAIKLISGEKKLSGCKPLIEEEKYRKNREFLEKLFNPLL
ncbi:MAG: tRNA CCA-pyrophosphorylase [Candidatus Hecatellales archaeon B24]|nr:MAG: tRNA CCA-pyrophosphorylase [Candidatus Hecatellales archaeon B24]